MPANGLFKPAIWQFDDYTRLRIGRKTAVFSGLDFSARNFLLPRIIIVDNRINSGIPTIRDHTARLRLPMKISSNISAIKMIETKINTLTIPRKVRMIIQICSVSLASSGLSKADSLSMKESPLMMTRLLSSN